MPHTIWEAAPRIRAGELTPSDLLEQCLARIDAYEPSVRAWAYLDRGRARREAAQLTEELQRGQYRGPLHGIPIGIKDIIDVFDMPTACGSKLWANSVARQDAACVKRLRAAGAIILGKTVTTAYAYLDPSPTRNPWNLHRTPGGSSSGSAAAVACGMALATLGTQTGGSITRPASFCGVYSLKPTWGHVSVEGVLPLAPSLDHVGVMANCVQDLEYVYRTIACPPGRIDARPSEESFSNRESLPLELTADFFITRTETALLERFVQLPDRLASSGEPFTFPSLTLPPAFGEIPTAHKAIMACEAAAYHAARLRERPEDYPPRITELVEEGLAITGAAFYQATRLRDELRAEFQHRRSPRTLLVPAATGPAPTPETTGNAALNAPWSFLGFPVLSLPFDHTEDGMPLAVQLVGGCGTEERLFPVAKRIATALGDAKRWPPLPNPKGV
ncbi:MAG: amidase [Bacteroidales bacterium]|nr:amidase [Bacteroidales bacterium]